MSKLLWDTTRDPKPIIAEYIKAVYGKGAPFIAQWLDRLHQGARTNNVHARIYDRPTAPYLAPDVLAGGEKLFNAAEQATANDAQALAEVQRARLALEYVQLMTAKADSPERADLARRVAGKIRRYGIGQIREGQDVAVFLKSIGQ